MKAFGELVTGFETPKQYRECHRQCDATKPKKISGKET